MRKELRPYQREALLTIKAKLKETPNPLLVTASVGAGKSLIISELLLWIERAGFRALCLTLNSTLIQQNADTHQSQGGNPGIYCAGLNAKDTENLVIFGSPQSVAKAIRNKEAISQQPFNLIVVDECHNIAPHNASSMYMRLIKHYGLMAQTQQYSFRIFGLTGTPYRDKAISIAGQNMLFKEEIVNISTAWLIDNGYLVRPTWGAKKVDSFDMRDLRVDNLGKFKHKDLDRVVNKEPRKTAMIMQEVAEMMTAQQRKGAFIFATSIAHCMECLRSLPSEESAIIVGDTKQDERIRVLDLARKGKIKYLINVNVLTVGVDCPIFDTVVFVRPTESLVLYVQAIGRGLRLHDSKQSCLVLDYAGNLERHGDIDHPLINEALQPKEPDDPDYCIPCFHCGQQNTVLARRCVGTPNGKRCDHYFEFKECPSCAAKNDTTARQCRVCSIELIDPNKKLTLGKPERVTVEVLQTSYSAIGNNLYLSYITSMGLIEESFNTFSHLGRNIMYGKLKTQIKTPSKYYSALRFPATLKRLVESGDLMTPSQLECVFKSERWQIVKRMFGDEIA